MGDQGQPLGPAPVVMTQDQLDDFASLLARYLTAETIRYIGDQILGAGALSQSGSAEDLAKFAVGEFSREGRVADAMALLRQDAKGHRRLLLGLNYIMNGKRLNSDLAYQKFVNDYEPFLDAGIIEDVLPKILRAVCAVALGGKIKKIMGSGFLIGPDLVMTNFHVIEDFLLLDKGKVVPNGKGDDIYFFFDYLSDPAPNVPPDSTVRLKSMSVQAADDWLVFARPSLDFDGTARASATVKTEYDYAVIRLKTRIGEVPSRRSGGAKRGWLTLPSEIDVITKDRKVMVFQHPETAPQKWDVGAYKGLDPSGTRLRYEVSTAHGSSGGAAVNADGGLFALHVAEVKPDPPAPALRQNQGVRMDRILEDLSASVQIPGLLTSVSDEDDSRLFWSLTDDLQNPQPIIGRAAFRGMVSNMMKPDGVRVLTVTGPAASGLRFSTKLLRRILGVYVPVTEFVAADLQSLKPADFLRRLLEDLQIPIPDNDKIPEPKDTEMLARWVRLDLPPWVARRFAADERNRKEAAHYPAWVILNTALWTPDGLAQRLLWAEHLRDLIAALLGVRDPGQPVIDIPQIRWLLLAPAGDMLTLREVPKSEEKLEANFDFEGDFAQCLEWAWRALLPNDGQNTDQLRATASYLKDLHDNPVYKTITLRKFLADGVSGIIRKKATRMAGR